MSNNLDQGAYGWHKASYSTGQAECIEQGLLPDGRPAVRDTKQEGTGPVLAFGRAQWAAFLKSVA